MQVIKTPTEDVLTIEPKIIEYHRKIFVLFFYCACDECYE